MAVLIASDLRKDMAGNPLFAGVSLKLERRDRLTIAGRNGAGKTTLLRMLAGETSVDGGEIVFEKGARIALHDQRPPRDRALTLREYVLSGATELVALEEKLSSLETAMAEGDLSDATMDAYAKAQSALEHAGGYTWRERAMGTIRGLGFDDDSLDRSLETFSGGELTRGSLARALISSPDLLLLDEPTNHLDIAALEWLEKTLVEMDTAIILVAHDRWFLESVGTAVLELEAGKSRFFKGTWHQWRREQAAREMALGKAIDKQAKEIERMERFVERFRAKASKAKQAQSRVKALDKIDRIERDPRHTREMAFAFKAPERSGKVVFELSGARLITPGEHPRTLIDEGELWLERGEHVALVGANGTGKTTLVHALAGRREFEAGKLSTGHNVTLGFLSQHAEELHETGSVLEAAVRATTLAPNKARALLGQFLFSGEQAEKPVSGLSGGERRRLSLAILVASGANVLILDEPTNHLDLESREALEDALSGYQGAVILVSHDRALLDAVGTRTVAIEDGALRSYEGGWADYVDTRKEEDAAARRPAPNAAVLSSELTKNRTGKAGSGHGGGNGNGNGKRAAKVAAPSAKPARSKNSVRREADLEKAIERAEKELATVEDELADPSAWASPTSSQRSTERHDAAKAKIASLMAEWEAVAG